MIDMLDEEAQANKAAMVKPPPQPPVPPPAGPTEAPDPEMLAEKGAPAQEPPPAVAGQPRSATPLERKLFDKLFEQTLSLLTLPDSAEYLIMQSKRTSPEEVLAEAVAHVVNSAVTAAAAAGVEIPSAVKKVTTKAAVVTLAAVMVKAGLAQSAEKVARSALALIQRQEAAPAQPAAQPPMEAANGVAG